jgi:4-amino-4-deoxy-L-arabinose transferase-like glycosyltransferase
VASWLALIGLVAGSWLLMWLLPADHYEGQGEILILGAGLGLGVLGLFSLLLGWVGLYRPAVAYVVTVALSLVLVPQVARLWRRGRAWRPGNLPGVFTALYLSVTALWALLLAVLPPTDWDGLFYHLTGPKLYVQAGHLLSGIDIPHLNFPSLMEMLYAWAMLLRGDIAAKLLHAVFGMLLAGMVYLIARNFIHQKAAWPALLIFASMPMVGTLAGWAYNDLALAFYQITSLYAFIKYERMDRRSQSSDFRWLILSGIFAGLAMGLKYTSFVTPVVITLLVIWYSTRPAHFKTPKLLLNVSLFALPALLIALPWYVKNVTFTGNPVYPFFSGLFNGQFWDSFRADWYAASGTGIGWRPATLLALPWLLTLGVRDMNYWDGRTGPLFLLFLPLVLVYGVSSYARKRDDHPPVLGSLLVFALAQFGFWTAGVVWSRSLWQSRLLLPGLAALSPVIGWLWTDLPRFDMPHFSLHRFVNLVVILVLGLTLIDMGLFTLKVNPLPYLLGAETRDEYLARRLGAYYASMQKINQDLPHDAVIVFLWEPRSYYCQRDCRPDSILDSFPHMVHQYHSAGAIASAWQQAGVTHVLVHRSGLDFLLNEDSEPIDLDVLNTLESQYLEQTFDVAGAYQLYALKATP